MDKTGCPLREMALLAHTCIDVDTAAGSRELMDKREYIRRFDLEASTCRDLARTCVIEALPVDIRFDVALHREPNARGKIKYVGGRLLDPAAIRSLSYMEACEMHWVEGSVPRWINMNVSRVDGDATIIEIATTDMLISQEDRLLHRWAGNPPFQVLGPPNPFGWSLAVDGKFSLDWCRNRETADSEIVTTPE